MSHYFTTITQSHNETLIYIALQHCLIIYHVFQVHKLMQENQVLRHGEGGGGGGGAPGEQTTSSVNGHEVLREGKTRPKPSPRPNSMFEARDQDRHHRWNKVPVRGQIYCNQTGEL